jgi:hypothetical protein
MLQSREGREERRGEERQGRFANLQHSCPFSTINKCGFAKGIPSKERSAGYTTTLGQHGVAKAVLGRAWNVSLFSGVLRVSSESGEGLGDGFPCLGVLVIKMLLQLAALHCTRKAGEANTTLNGVVGLLLLLEVFGSVLLPNGIRFGLVPCPRHGRLLSVSSAHGYFVKNDSVTIEEENWRTRNQKKFMRGIPFRPNE